MADPHIPETIVLFDHNRAATRFDSEVADLLKLIHESHDNEVKSLHELIEERKTRRSTILESRLQRTHYLASKLADQRESYHAESTNCVDSSSVKAKEITEETTARFEKLHSDILDLMSKSTRTSTNLIHDVHKKSMDELERYTKIQIESMNEECTHTRTCLGMALDEVDYLKMEIDRVRNGSVSYDEVMRTQSKRDKLKSDLLEADRESVAIRNFGRACIVLDKEISEIKNKLTELAS